MVLTLDLSRVPSIHPRCSRADLHFHCFETCVISRDSGEGVLATTARAGSRGSTGGQPHQIGVDNGKSDRTRGSGLPGAEQL